MKILSTANVCVFGVVLASARISHAARETLAISEGGVTFTIVRYDDGRNKPYRLQFRQDGIRSLYMFNTAGFVTNVKVDAERYKALYDSSNNLENVELTSSSRRHLTEEETDVTMFESRRLDFADCSDCAEVWDALCYEGVPSVCDLVDFGSVFSTKATASIDTACDTFGPACSSYTARAACEGQCTNEAGVSSSTQASSSNPCLDPTSEDYKCTFSGDTTIIFTECDLVDADIPFLPACFEEFGKTNIEELLLDENHDVTTYPEGTFAGLSELTFLDLYSNGLSTLPEGLFSGLTKLEFLDLAFNNLMTLPEGVLSDLASLQILRLFDNELKPESLSLGLFSGVPQLQELHLSGNRLTDFTGLEGIFDGLTELTDLSLGENNLVTVPDGLFAGLTKLERLSFYIGQLTTVPAGLSDLTALRTLDLIDNAVTSLGESLSGLTELRALRLDFNDVLLPEDVFADLANLETLSLTGCGLTTLPVGLFSPLENLVRLDLWENEDLQCIPPNTATSVNLDSEDVGNGTCVCTPVEAVLCDTGLSCEGGETGYTCVSE